MTCGEFAVFVDGSRRPAAIFADLEDAMKWGLDRYGADRFSIRRFQAVMLGAHAAEAEA